MNPDCDFVASAELFSVAFCESLRHSIILTRTEAACNIRGEDARHDE